AASAARHISPKLSAVASYAAAACRCTVGPGSRAMLQIIGKHAENTAFQPEEVAILVAAFDGCWNRLLKSGVQYGSERAMQAARERLGEGIIQAAKGGERDPGQLCQDAMLYVAKSDRGR